MNKKPISIYSPGKKHYIVVDKHIREVMETKLKLVTESYILVNKVCFNQTQVARACMRCHNR